MNRVLRLLIKLPPWLTFTLIMCIAVGGATFVCQGNINRYKKICAYADSHAGRVEPYIQGYGSISRGGTYSYQGYRVLMPDGTYIYDTELSRKGEI